MIHLLYYMLDACIDMVSSFTIWNYFLFDSEVSHLYSIILSLMQFDHFHLYNLMCNYLINHTTIIIL